MKNIHPCLTVLIFFLSGLLGLASCDSDTSMAQQEENKNPPVSTNKANQPPGNSGNPYDEAGRLHNELLATYLANGDLGGSVQHIATKVQGIADDNSSFNALKGQDCQGIPATAVQYLLDHPQTCVDEVISASSMTAAGKTSLADFAHSFLLLCDREDDCDVLYKAVADYESTVTADATLTAGDKRLILTTTSIARHSTYKARKRPKKNTDPDWTIFVGNIIVATQGAEHGTADAVTRALVTGLAQNP